MLAKKKSNRICYWIKLIFIETHHKHSAAGPHPLIQTKSKGLSEKTQTSVLLLRHRTGPLLMIGGMTKTKGADATENNVDAEASAAAADDGNGAGGGGGLHRNRTLRCVSCGEVEPDRLHPAVICCNLWLGALRYRPGRWGSACWSPATGRRSPCGINAYTGDA